MPVESAMRDAFLSDFGGLVSVLVSAFDVGRITREVLEHAFLWLDQVIGNVRAGH